MLLIILIIIAVFLITAVILILSDSLRTGIVPMPSLPSERRAVSKALNEYPGIRMITDLGSGWGGLTRSLRTEFPDYQIRAVERSLIPHRFAALISGIMCKRIEHIRTDIFNIKLEQNQAYITYLSGDAMKKLRRLFERDLPSGGILISIAFAMPGWTETSTCRAGGILKTPLYIYKF